MIPTLLLVGVVLGRWWRVVLPLAVVGWIVLLIATDVGSGFRFVVEAGLLAAANVIVGAILNQAVRALVHRIHPVSTLEGPRRSP
jgi:hypothetical protein